MLHSCEAENNFSKLSLQEKFPPIMLEESLTYFLFSMGSISVIGVIQDKTIQQKKKKRRRRRWYSRGTSNSYLIKSTMLF
jgi:hypothetical protein